MSRNDVPSWNPAVTERPRRALEGQVVLGVDGGGSKTTALVADRQGQVLGRGSAGPSNYQVVGSAQAWQAMDAAIRGAMAEGGVEPRSVAAICLGLAGVDRPEDLAVVWDGATQRWPADRITIVNDAQLVLAAGTPAGWGVALIAGTGSIVYGRSPSGSLARAGGWGYILGDEGSGYAVGLAALRAVARADDRRGAETRLTAAILAEWVLPAADSLIQRVYVDDIAPAAIAGLAPVVARLAAEGDQVSQSIIDDACSELALAAAAVVRQLQLEGSVPCAVGGGLLVHVPAMTSGIQAAAASLDLRLTPMTTVREPAAGAVRLANDQCDSRLA